MSRGCGKLILVSVFHKGANAGGKAENRFAKAGVGGRGGCSRMSSVDTTGL